MRILTIAPCVLVGLALAFSARAAQRAPTPTTSKPGAPSASSASRLYTDAQAKRGDALYQENCAFCHGSDLAGTLSAPPINGPALLTRWSNRPVSDLFTFVQVFMPWNSPGGLSRQQNSDILAFMFKRADFPPGTTEFPPDADAQTRLSIVAGK